MATEFKGDVILNGVKIGTNDDLDGSLTYSFAASATYARTLDNSSPSAGKNANTLAVLIDDLSGKGILTK